MTLHATVHGGNDIFAMMGFGISIIISFVAISIKNLDKPVVSGGGNWSTG